MFLIPNKQVRDSIKTMSDVKGRELGNDQEEENQDYSVMSVSSCCFSEEILGENSLMRAN